MVGPKVSGELFTGGLEALGVAIGLMLLYIWFRFQLQFGLGAVIALFHDIILTMGILSVFHIEFSMPSIAALLTVIGYSMNEKVISLRPAAREPAQVPAHATGRHHQSVGERAAVAHLDHRLDRALGASGMLFLGGPTIFPVVFAMVFGIVVGTYSSIYVALPVILLWGVNRGDEEAQPLKPINARP